MKPDEYSPMWYERTQMCEHEHKLELKRLAERRWKARQNPARRKAGVVADLRVWAEAAGCRESCRYGCRSAGRRSFESRDQHTERGRYIGGGKWAKPNRKVVHITYRYRMRPSMCRAALKLIASMWGYTSREVQHFLEGLIHV